MIAQSEVSDTSSITDTVEAVQAEQNFDDAFNEFSQRDVDDVDTDNTSNNLDEQQSLLTEADTEQTSIKPEATDNADTIASLRQEIEQLKQAQQSQEPEEQADQPVEAAETDYMQGDEWNALKEDLPEVAQVIEAQKEQIDNLQTQMHGVTAQSVEQYQAQQINLMDENIPDWRDVSSSDNFSQWVQTQPGQVQQLAASADASEVTWLINLYKQQATEDIKERRQQTAQAAVEVPTKKSGARPSGSVPDDFDKAFDYYAKQ